MWHIYPVNDLEPHELKSTCHCQPAAQMMEFGDMMIVHNSFDGREGLEIVNQILEPEK